MSLAPSVAQWTPLVATQLPHLSQPQATVLAWWSLGMVLARSCGLTAVSVFVAGLQHRQENTVRQQLREWCYEAPAKRGVQRQALAVEACFAPLLRWVLQWWQGDQLALALDATTLGDRFAVLAISVLYRGCAIPVAWAVLPATAKGAWKPEWRRLLQHLHATVPATMTVIVLADRGLYGRWLFRAIVHLGWHPLLRVNGGGLFRPQGRARWRPLASYAPAPGTQWQCRGTAFKTHPLACTLLACWEPGQAERWLLITDLPPAASTAAWYGLRVWIEQGFKLTKRGGWQWQRTRMTHPARAARLWLAVAVATLWLVSVGGVAEDAIVGRQYGARCDGVARRAATPTPGNAVAPRQRVSAWLEHHPGGAAPARAAADRAVEARALARPAGPTGGGRKPCHLKKPTPVRGTIGGHSTPSAERPRGREIRADRGDTASRRRSCS